MKERNGRGKKKGKTLDGKGNRIGTKMRRERQSNILPETRLESFCVPHVVNHRTNRMKKEENEEMRSKSEPEVNMCSE